MTLLKELSHKDHIIWDWNGTVLDDVEHAVNTINNLLNKHQLPLIAIEEYRKIFEFPIRKYYDKLGFDYSKSII